MSVSTKHPEYLEALKTVRLTRDAVKGDPAIKKGGELYLPAEFADSDTARYKAYKNRSFFLGVTKQAQKSTMGMIFRKQPDVGEGLPAYLESIQFNIDGSGQSLEQVAKFGVKEMEETGRVGLFVDYPPIDTAVTRSQEAQAGARPVLISYEFEQIINWRTTVENGIEKLSLVVLEEKVLKESNTEFQHDMEKQYRILRLRDGIYTVEVLDEHGETIEDEFPPLMAGGEPFDHIPFYIPGTENNRPCVDAPLLADLAVVNIAHYQTTADHRENLYIHGQLTLGIATKLDYHQFKEANPDGIKVGSRSGHYLGEGGSFQTATAPESSSLRVGLQDLEEQMVSIGAKLVTKSGQAETAEAARLKASGEASALDIMVNNYSDAIELALEDMLFFVGQWEPVTYRLNTQFFEDTLTPQLAAAITGFETAGTIAKRDARYMIRKGKIEIEEGRTDEEIDADIAGQVAIQTDI